MKHVLVALVLAAGLASAQEGSKEGCPSCKGKSAPASTALADARKAIAAAPKAEENLPADRKAELTKARDLLKESAFGKAMGPSFETCGLLALAAAKQEGSTPEATALLKEMGATYCGLGKMFGGCADCDSCDDAGGSCDKCCANMSAADLAKKANASLENANKLMAAAKAEMEKMTPEQKQKMEAAGKIAMENCPRFQAMMGAAAALNGAYASLAKMGIPAADAKNDNARDGLVRAAMALHVQLTSCDSCEECEGCEGSEEGDAEEPEETEAPASSS